MKADALKLLWTMIGLTALFTGIVGIFLPLLPTVPFVLLAAFCFSRGNRQWEKRMLNHAHLGPMIRNWRRYRVVPLRAKLLATLMMTISSVGGWILLAGAYRWIPTLTCLTVSVWLWRLPHAHSELPIDEHIGND